MIRLCILKFLVESLNEPDDGPTLALHLGLQDPISVPLLTSTLLEELLIGMSSFHHEPAYSTILVFSKLAMTRTDNHIMLFSFRIHLYPRGS